MLRPAVHPTGHAQGSSGRDGAARPHRHRPQHAPGGGPRDRDTAAGRVLDTGALRVTVPVSGPTLAELAHDDGAVQPIAAPTLLLDGAPPATPAIARVAVETVGPVRTELLVTG